MKSLVTLCAMLVCGLSFAGEPTSVLNHGTPTPAAAPAAAPAATAGPAIIAVPRKSRCANSQCQLYSVEEQSHEYTRHRVLGGQVIRKNNRTVIRPIR